MFWNKFLKNTPGRLFAVAGVLSIAAASVSASIISGGSTTVTLDTATVGALTGLGFTIAPISGAMLGGTPLAATFPITGGDTTTMIDHSGGLAFTKSGVTADIQNFIINLSGAQANTITGQLVTGGSTVNGVALFDIGSGLSLTLDSQLAGDLSSAFGIPNLAGTTIGTAAVSATTATPEPGSRALAMAGLLPLAYFLRGRVRRVEVR